MSKWANRLKGAISKTEKSEQYLDSALTITDKTPQNELLSVIVSGQFGHSLKNDVFETEKNRVRKIEQSLNSALTIADETKNDAILSRINRLISEGVKFEVSADSFEIFGVSERERIELEANRAGVLCTLQQMFLTKHLFSRSPELLKAFKTEVEERSATMTDGGGEIVFQALCEICSDWIGEAIENNGD